MVELKKTLDKIVELGFLPTDDTDLRLKKMALTLVPLMIGPLAFIWSITYFLLGHSFPGLISLMYSIISTVSLAYYFKTKKTRFIQYSQLTMVLVLPFLLMWSLGGFVAGSMVMIWAIFAPIAALMYMDRSAAMKWFLAYLVLILISAPINDYTSSVVSPLPELARNIFFLLNFGCASAGLYLLVAYSIDQAKQAIARLKSKRARLKIRTAELNKANQTLKVEMAGRELIQQELIKAIDVANAANQAKSEFLASMSHELRTPLNAILGYAQLFNMDATLPEDVKVQSREIESAGRYLLTLINDMLDLARIEAGKLDYSFERFSINTVLAESLAMASPLASSYGISLIDEGSERQTEMLHVDRVRLKQVMNNLLSNAIKYNRPQGTVRLSCSVGEDRMRISVADTGSGIPVDKQSRIFNAFDRLGKENGVVEGTGIGLIITKRITEGMGGEIGFESVEGRGSTFWVEFSLSSELDAPTSAQDDHKIIA